jgi:hypothetical protein
MSPYRWALLLVSIAIIVLLWWGVQWLDIPPIYRQVLLHYPLLRYQGYILVACAVLLAWFHSWAAMKILWICEKLHRWLSALMMLGAIWIEATMHIFNIPHIEGWYMPIVGGSAFASAITVWIQKWKKKP